MLILQLVYISHQVLTNFKLQMLAVSIPIVIEKKSPTRKLASPNLTITEL